MEFVEFVLTVELVLFILLRLESLFDVLLQTSLVLLDELQFVLSGVKVELVMPPDLVSSPHALNLRCTIMKVVLMHLLLVLEPLCAESLTPVQVGSKRLLDQHATVSLPPEITTQFVLSPCALDASCRLLQLRVQVLDFLTMAEIRIDEELRGEQL